MKGQVLIVEDNLETRDLYRLALDGNEIDVQTRNSAAEALTTLSAGRVPQLILCDYMMPGMDGGNFVREIRKNDRWKGIRVILISGVDNLNDVARDCGADDFLKKPFGLDELEAIVLYHLSKS